VKSKTSSHIFLFILTFFTLTFKERTFDALYIVFDWIYFSLTGLELFQEHTLMIEAGQQIWVYFQRELSYSIPLLTILFAHEMGHYVPARIYGIKATLPYFIPMPFGPIGTMGAVIKIEEAIPDKKKLFDIGVGGPLMSFILSIPCWLIGVYYSEVVNIADYMSLMTHGVQGLVFGDSLFTFYTIQWIHGSIDMKTQNLVIHPLAQAGWVGFFVTAINLFPFGQLDGGHVIYSLFGEKYRNWIYYLFLGFVFLGFLSLNWVIWGFIIYFFIKVEHPFVPDHKSGLNKWRKFIGFFMLFSLVLIFVPTPIATLSELNTPTLIDDLINMITSKL
jgi:membrane-associated protease RseP (regulator of RpoE activity)